MIRCTETNEPVYTGVSMDESAFESSDLGTWIDEQVVWYGSCSVIEPTDVYRQDA